MKRSRSSCSPCLRCPRAHWLFPERVPFLSGQLWSLQYPYPDVVLDDAVIFTCDGTEEKVSVEEAEDGAKSLNNESTVYLQKNDDGDVIAVYDMWLKVDVEFAEGWEDVDANATITAPVMYLYKSAKNFTVSVSKWVNVKEINNGYTADSEKEHNVARTFTAKSEEVVNGDIVVTLAADEPCNQAWLELVDGVEAQNLKVELDQPNNKVIITTDDGTIKVNDVAAFLKAAGNHVQGYEFYNNTTSNLVPKTSTDNFEITNLFILVTAENGDTVKYTFEAGTAAAP